VGTSNLFFLLADLKGLQYMRSWPNAVGNRQLLAL